MVNHSHKSILRSFIREVIVNDLPLFMKEISQREKKPVAHDRHFLSSIFEKSVIEDVSKDIMLYDIIVDELMEYHDYIYKYSFVLSVEKGELAYIDTMAISEIYLNIIYINKISLCRGRYDKVVGDLFQDIITTNARYYRNWYLYEDIQWTSKGDDYKRCNDKNGDFLFSNVSDISIYKLECKEKLAS